MRQVLVRLLCAIFACFVGWAPAVRAASVGRDIPAGANLAVERARGAEECPNASQLSGRIASIRGHDGTHGTTVYSVSFKRTGTEFSASIRVGGSSVRVLRTRGPNCAALGQAVAVTLVLFIDSEEAAPPPPLATTEPKPEPAPKLELPPSPRAAPRRRADVTGSLGAGVGALVGVLGPIAPTLLAEAELSVDHFRGGLGALWGLPRTFSLAPGSVRQSLFAGTLRGCWGIAGDPKLRLDLCTGAFGGASEGRAQGYSNNLYHRRPWLVVPVELSLARLSGPIALELTASVLAPLIEHDFGVEGVGVAYRSPALAGMLSVRVHLVFPE